MSSSSCKVPLCDWISEDVYNRDIAGCLATWHVYEKHPDVWRQVIGDRPPVDPDPRTSEGMAIIMSSVIPRNN